MAVAQILKKLFGSKADRDMKQLKPILDQILAAYGPIDKLSNDELRAKTNELRAKLRECEAPFEKRIAEIKQKLDEDIPVNEKETLAYFIYMVKSNKSRLDQKSESGKQLE